MSKYIYIGLKKKNLFGWFYNRRKIRDNDNAEGIEMSIYSAFPYTRCTFSLSLL